MSKARLVITAVVVGGRSQAEDARDYGVPKGWVSRLVARYRAEAEVLKAGWTPARTRGLHHRQGGQLRVNLSQGSPLSCLG